MIDSSAVLTVFQVYLAGVSGFSPCVPCHYKVLA